MVGHNHSTQHHHDAVLAFHRPQEEISIALRLRFELTSCEAPHHRCNHPVRRPTKLRNFCLFTIFEKFYFQEFSTRLQTL